MGPCCSRARGTPAGTHLRRARDEAGSIPAIRSIRRAVGKCGAAIPAHGNTGEAAARIAAANQLAQSHAHCMRVSALHSVSIDVTDAQDSRELTAAPVTIDVDDSEAGRTAGRNVRIT